MQYLPHLHRFAGGIAVVLAASVLTACERPPVQAVQRGFRGTAMVEVYNPRSVAEQAPAQQAPAALPPASNDGPKAASIYQNVQVLGHLSVGEFTRTMLAMTAWVAPQQGCTYCHNAANFAEDAKYTKVVARRMLQMTRQINAGWTQHVAATGVTCYTCHRGNAIPSAVWFKPAENARGGMLQTARTNGTPSAGAGSSIASLPADPFTPYFLQAQDIRINGEQALATGNRHSIMQAEWTYSLMNHMSTSLGVNCTYCHNSDSFASWSVSTPQRATAWYGIRMVRSLNVEYLEPLTSTFPAYRHGPTGDVAKVNCTTCHQGVYKPLYGAPMARDYPALSAEAAQLVSSAVVQQAPQTPH